MHPIEYRFYFCLGKIFTSTLLIVTQTSRYAETRHADGVARNFAYVHRFNVAYIGWHAMILLACHTHLALPSFLLLCPARSYRTSSTSSSAIARNAKHEWQIFALQCNRYYSTNNGRAWRRKCTKKTRARMLGLIVSIVI